MRLGVTIPDFCATTTHGELCFYEYLDKSWGVIFSHPADFTPVCTTELGAVARLSEEFRKRNVRVLALSVDELEKHQAWIKDINDTQNTVVNFPIIADPDFRIAKLLDLADPEQDDRFTVRSLLIIGPDKKLKLSITYPASTGRNFNEVLRVIDSLQLTATHEVATPANWKQGEDVVLLPSMSSEEASKRFSTQIEEQRSYLRYIPQPDQP